MEGERTMEGRVDILVESDAEAQAPVERRAKRLMEPVVKLERISKRFASGFALQDVSLEVLQGQIICIVGPSGAGKTTLLRCINLLEIPDAGKIYLHDRLVYDADANPKPRIRIRDLIEHRQRIGFVFQNFNLWPHKTVIENIIEGPVIVKKIPKREAIEQAQALLKKVGLTSKGDCYPDSLSGGEIQRTAIARALAMDPEILLLDEITSALDVELIGEVLDLLKTLAREGKTMVIVTHELQFAKEVGDLIIFLDEGRIVEMAEPGVFFKNPRHERTKRFLNRLARSGRYLGGR
jgi:ABC-type polar amino acid transport system ATPase subunit